MKAADIARIKLTKQEEKKFEKDFKTILDWASQLEELKQLEESKGKKAGTFRADITGVCEEEFPFSGEYIKAKKAL